MIKTDARISLAIMKNVCKIYSNKGWSQTVLKDVSFEACAGEFILLLGPSGSGKTTLLTLLGAMQQQSKGEIFLFGKNIRSYSAKEIQKIRASKIGFIFQTFNLIESISVGENLMLIQKFAGFNDSESKGKINEMLSKMQLLHRYHALPKTMSQGEKQRAAIARALINGSSLIIADEPTGSLNSELAFQVIQLLKEAVTNENRCVVVASHDERIAGYSDKVWCIKDGLLHSCSTTPKVS